MADLLAEEAPYTENPRVSSKADYTNLAKDPLFWKLRSSSGIHWSGKTHLRGKTSMQPVFRLL